MCSNRSTFLHLIALASSKPNGRKEKEELKRFRETRRPNECISGVIKDFWIDNGYQKAYVRIVDANSHWYWTDEKSLYEPLGWCYQHKIPIAILTNECINYNIHFTQFRVDKFQT